MNTDKSCIFSRKKTACSLKKCSWCLPIDKATTFFRIAIYTHTHNHMSIFSGLHDGMRSSMRQKKTYRKQMKIYTEKMYEMHAVSFVKFIFFSSETAEKVLCNLSFVGTVYRTLFQFTESKEKFWNSFINNQIDYYHK